MPLTKAFNERRSLDVRTALLVVLGVLAASNLATNAWLPAWAYVPWNASIAAIVVVVALRVVAPGHLGFTAWRSGLRWGLVLLAGMVAVLVVGAVVPTLRQLFEDDRVDGRPWLLAYHTLVRIPLGTVLLEEVAFRGVVPGLLAVRYGVIRGSLIASVLFGLWHVLPAVGLYESNEAVAGWLGSGAAGLALAVTLSVLGTALVGLWWCWVRYRSGSLLAPVIGHIASNSLSYAFAWVITY